MLFTVLIPVIAFVVAAVIFFYIGIAYRKKIAESTVNSAEEQAKRIIEDSKKDAERTKKEVIDELPEKIEQKFYVEMEKEHKRAYKSFVNLIKRRILEK